MDRARQQQRRWRLTSAGPATTGRSLRSIRQTTCDRLLPILRPHLSEGLVSARAFERVRSVSRFVPSSCLGAIEVRLAGGKDVVDLAFRLDQPAQARAVVPHLASPHLAELVEQWSCAAPTWSLVRSIWLEVDLDAPIGDTALDGLPEPVVCVELGARPEADWLIQTLVPALDGRSVGAARRRQLDRSLAVLPDASALLYVFGLRARRQRASRFEIHRIDDRVDPGQMVTCLREIAGQETADRVGELIPLITGCDRFHLSFDIGETIGPAIGIEASFRGLPHRQPGWRRLLDRLVARQLCAPEKAEALWRWPGWSSPATDHASWPEAHGYPGAFAARCLSHIKLVSRPAAPPEAKAYLLFEFLDKREVA